jgi:hypothetical protein
LKESKNLPPKDTKLVKEYVGKYDPQDGSSVVQGRIIGIDENVLHKILHLSITEISVGGEVSNDFNSGSYFKGGASSFEKS